MRDSQQDYNPSEDKIAKKAIKSVSVRKKLGRNELGSRELSEELLRRKTDQYEQGNEQGRNMK